MGRQVHSLGSVGLLRDEFIQLTLMGGGMGRVCSTLGSVGCVCSTLGSMGHVCSTVGSMGRVCSTVGDSPIQRLM